MSYPKYCLYEDCPQHCHPGEGFSRRGLDIRGYQRYRCRSCGRSTNSKAFQLNYRYRQDHRDLCSKIFQSICMGLSNRRTAKLLGVSEHWVRIRLRRMSQWALLRHTQLSNHFEIHEPIVYDGVENFAGSQYDPNNINHAVGFDSLFVYDFNFLTLTKS